MKQLLTGCLIFSFIKTKQNKKHFFLLSPCCMLCTHWDLRTALVQRRKQAHGVCHLVTEAGFTPSPPDSKTHRWVLLKMDVTVRWGGGVQEGPQCYSVEDLGAEVSHSWGGLVRGPSLLSWLSILGVCVGVSGWVLTS